MAGYEKVISARICLSEVKMADVEVEDNAGLYTNFPTGSTDATNFISWSHRLLGV